MSTKLLAIGLVLVSLGFLRQRQKCYARLIEIKAESEANARELSRWKRAECEAWTAVWWQELENLDPGDKVRKFGLRMDGGKLTILILNAFAEEKDLDRIFGDAGYTVGRVRAIVDEFDDKRFRSADDLRHHMETSLDDGNDAHRSMLPELFDAHSEQFARLGSFLDRVFDDMQ